MNHKCVHFLMHVIQNHYIHATDILSLTIIILTKILQEILSLIANRSQTEVWLTLRKSKSKSICYAVLQNIALSIQPIIMCTIFASCVCKEILRSRTLPQLVSQYALVKLQLIQKLTSQLTISTFLVQQRNFSMIKYRNCYYVANQQHKYKNLE